MAEIDDLLTANDGYAAARGQVPNPGPRPSRRLAIVTCMDARIDLLAGFGLELNEAHVIRNAGGRVTEDVLRSLTVSSHVLGVETVVVMQHTQCGLTGKTNEGLQALTGADFDFRPIDDHERTLRQDVALVADQPYLEHLRAIAGLIYDVVDGRVSDEVRWERSVRL